jgi:hypothetical protein
MTLFYRFGRRLFLCLALSRFSFDLAMDSSSLEVSLAGGTLHAD